MEHRTFGPQSTPKGQIASKTILSVTKQADIVRLPYVVIEAKSPESRIDDEAIAPLDSYAMWLPAKFGVACDGISFVLRGYFEGNEIVYLVNKILSIINKDLISLLSTKNGQ